MNQHFDGLTKLISRIDYQSPSINRDCGRDDNIGLIRGSRLANRIQIWF